jgi:D-sedoheptulose 7-phosphate isomerase
MTNKEHIEAYFSQMASIINSISTDDLDKIINLLFEAWQNRNQVFICGNGGSASTATHFACDLAKTTIVEGKKRFKVMGLNDNIPLMSAIINDEGFDNLFYEQLLNHFQKGDILICLSVHGGAGRDKAGLWSQNLLKSMKLAKDLGGKTIGFSGFDGGPIKEIADACVVVPVNSTPQVESFHLALEHLICRCLKEKIAEYKGD